jgi:glyoxylase-like metal-dependent hydrolase (beta-lactamase superfamily II)
MRLAFPRARYLVGTADWEAFHRPDVQARFPFSFVETSITPLERFGALELVAGDHTLTGELAPRAAPGHTPGHMMLQIDSEEDRALLVADALLHPAQVTGPGRSSMFDMDPERDRQTRRALLDRLESDALLFAASHFPEPAFGRVVREGGRQYWQPAETVARP